VVRPDDVVGGGRGRLLPGATDEPTAWVNRMLADARRGCLPGPLYGRRPSPPVDRSLGLEFIGQASVGVGADQFGTQVGGGSPLSSPT
jgi:hypothetical protein